MTLGQRIQEHRLRLGLSQAGLGEKLGVSRQAVSRWEADGAVLDTDKLIALSKLFGLTLNELLQVENLVNQEILKAVPVSVQEMGIEEARLSGAMALFGEKYGDVVRVVSVTDGFLLLAAVCFLAGLAVGRAPDIAARLGPPDPKEWITEWSLRAAPFAYELDGREVVDLYVGVTLEDSEILEDTEVFFQAESAGGETIRAEPVNRRESLYGVSCSAMLTVPNEAGRILIGFRTNGRERLQILDEFGRLIPSQE